MARSTNFRKFSDGGDVVSFSSLKFRRELDNTVAANKDKGIKLTKEAVYEEIADKASVSKEAVKKWAQGHNGPSDVQTIKNIASVLGTDYQNLIVKGNELNTETIEQSFEPAFSDERSLVIQMYRLFVDYGYWFFGTVGDCYAAIVLEDYVGEQERYIMNLYNFLDSVALYISQDSYGKLRKTITHLDTMFKSSMCGNFLPAQWVMLNPRLQSEGFCEYLIESYDEKLSEFFAGYLSDNDSPLEDVRNVLHMLLEDMPEIDAKLEELREKEYFSSEPCVALEQSINYEHTSYLDMPPYKIVAREMASTLTMVMRDDFPQYFGGNQGNE